ncbi:hypothetical protein PG994_014079 [Apiospora phragmitis]|uniref:Uncharacterized protein n=1 Tax=Apiospora phragmitis TaxID=2905665 RepID=A0ABR1T3B3_9PEZI
MLPSTPLLALLAGTAAAAAVSNDGSCSTKTVCADYVNACGQMYGGCFSACTPWPSFTAPPCTLETISVSTTGDGAMAVAAATAATGSSTGGGLPCDGSRLCVDHVRTCGATAVLTYGGCYPACSPSPTFSAPPCPTAAAPGITPPPAASQPCGGTTACQDSLRTCGTSTVLTYGGCWPACSPSPTFSAPPCPTSTA